MEQQTRQYIYGYNSQETAFEQEDYPWGFRLRTKIRYWVESKEGFGQRFCSQTMNPKTGTWCAPKKSTYAALIVMFKDEKGHIHTESVTRYHSDNLLEFKDRHLANLDDFQKEQLKENLAVNEVMSKVTWTIKRSEPVSLLSTKPEDVERRKQIEEEQEKRKQEQKKIVSDINKAIYYRKKTMEL
jgi:hypothetical protein